MSLPEPSIFETIFKQSPSPTIILKADAPAFTVVAQNQENGLLTPVNFTDITGEAFYKVFVFRPSGRGYSISL